MNNHNISIGLIGFGYWGKNLARNLNKLGVLKAICDLTEQNLFKSKTAYKHVDQYSNTNDFFNLELDAVFIATPAATHGKLVKKALENNKNVFVEKPLCLDVEEGINLIHLAKKNNLKLILLSII